MVTRVLRHAATIAPNWRRARHTTAPLRFVAREALMRCRGALYRLRRAPQVTVALRHVTPDLRDVRPDLCPGSGG